MTLQRLNLYRDTLLEWNQKVNLIGPEAVRNLDDHIAEAVQAAEILKPKGDVLDFGSGGGLPAIPMAIVSPEARFQLVEADQKKWAFLKFVARECQLNCIVHGDRLQRLIPRLDPELRFDLITSRAVGYPSSWLGLLSEHLTHDARVGLFHRGVLEDVPGFELVARHTLERGKENELVVLKRSLRGEHG